MYTYVFNRCSIKQKLHGISMCPRPLFCQGIRFLVSSDPAVSCDMNYLHFAVFGVAVCATQAMIWR